ncbi:MAG TPA: hypothetical protein VK063_10505 [Beutenbergiaceae bacterium]|nr:hypothetical protein [Beutenbergiaceae bacterium]
MSKPGQLLLKGDARKALKRGAVFGPGPGGVYRKATSITYDKAKDVTKVKLEPADG